MTKKILVFILSLIGLVALIVGPLFLTKMAQFKKMGEAAKNMVMPPTTVTATPAKLEIWDNLVPSTGSAAAVQGVTIGAEAGGKVVGIEFEAGAEVRKGDVLVRLDTSTEEAQFRAAQATADLAKANLARARELRQTNTNSAAELDAADAQAKQAQAQADSLRAVIDKKTIRAPFSGRLGLRMINLGQILKEGDAITNLETVSPIYVNFSLPQQRIPAIANGQLVRIQSDANPGKAIEGKITAVSPEVDPATRNLRVQATVDADAALLRPGMFVNVDVVLPTETKVLAIPVTSVLSAPYGDSVFVVDEQKDPVSGKVQQILRQQFIRVGSPRGDFVDVVAGLKPGETVVTSGVFKLRSGMPVVIDNTLAPPAELNPKPKNS